MKPQFLLLLQLQILAFPCMAAAGQPTTAGEQAALKCRIWAAAGRAEIDYRLPADFILAVIEAESSFNPKSVSHAGAQGLMQVMPRTGRSLGLVDPYDIEQNVTAGSLYLRQNLDRFASQLDLSGEQHNSLYWTLIAYHAGPTRLEKSLESARPHGIPSSSTRYAERVIERYIEFVRSFHGYGLWRVGTHRCELLGETQL